MGTIDADGHVIETPQTWSYLDEKDQRFSPMLLSYSAGSELRSNEGLVVKEFWAIEDRTHGKDRNVGTNTPKEAREMLSVAGRIAHMDKLGIDTQVLYPTLFLRPVVHDKERERALCHSYNRWLADIWQRSGNRLRWVVMLPLLSLETSPSLIEDEIRWAKEHGACGIFMRGLECDRTIGDPYFYPLWKMAGDTGLPICIHSANGSFTHHDFFQKDTSFTKFKLAVVGTFHSLLELEIPSKFPNVKWGFIEVSAQWLPYVLNDLADRFRRAGKTFPQSPLAANRVWVACENKDDLSYILSYAGEDNIMIGTDYGHHDPSTEINALKLLAADKRISPEAARKIMEDNPRRFYAL